MKANSLAEIFGLRISRKSQSYSILVAPQEFGKPSKESTEPDDNPARLYRQIPSIYAGVYAVASAVAGVPWRVYRRIGGDAEEDPNHPLAVFLRHPNPNDTAYSLKFALACNLVLYGDAYGLMEGGEAETGGIPITLTPLMSQRVRAIPDPVRKISGYRYQVNNRWLNLPREQILHIQSYSPFFDYRGQGSVEAATLAATLELYAIAFNKGFFKRGATLTGVLESEDDVDEDVMSRLLERFRMDHEGYNNAFRVRGLTSGLKYKPIQPTHQDMLFEHQRRMNREEMLMSVGTPPVMVTLLDGATWANAKEQRRQFWELTVIPILTNIEERISKDVAVRWGEDVFIAFDYSDIKALHDDLSVTIDAITRAVAHSVLTPNEGRVWLDTNQKPALPPLSGGDTPLVNISLVPAGEAASVAPQANPMVAASTTGDQINALLDSLKKGTDELVVHDSRNLRRETAWKVFDRQTVAFGRVFQRTSSDMFRDQQKRIVAHLEELIARSMSKAIDEVLRELEVGSQRWMERFGKVYSEAVRRSGKNALDGLGLADLDFQLHNPDVVAFITRQGAELVTGVNNTTKEGLRLTIAEGLANGETGLALSDRVIEVFDTSRFRANAIGRTESIKAFNFGAVEAYKQTDGLVDRKGWIATPDESVRDTHAEADGQIVPLNSYFIVGGFSMFYPGDPSGPAEEVVNCRCTVEPILSSEAAGIGDNGQPRRIHNA